MPDYIDDPYHFPTPDEEPTLFLPGPAEALDELDKPGTRIYQWGWTVIAIPKSRWYERLWLDIRLWINRKLGRHTITSWSLEDIDEPRT